MLDEGNFDSGARQPTKETERDKNLIQRFYDVLKDPGSGVKLYSIGDIAYYMLIRLNKMPNDKDELKAMIVQLVRNSTPNTKDLWRFVICDKGPVVPDLLTEQELLKILQTFVEETHTQLIEEMARAREDEAQLNLKRDAMNYYRQLLNNPAENNKMDYIAEQISKLEIEKNAILDKIANGGHPSERERSSASIRLNEISYLINKLKEQLDIYKNGAKYYYTIKEGNGIYDQSYADAPYDKQILMEEIKKAEGDTRRKNTVVTLKKILELLMQ